MRPICGAYEREAIRAHVLGRFGDMLLAVESPSGHADLSRQRAVDRPELDRRHTAERGLNENLAREILELHTLGVRTGLHAGRRHQLRQRHHRLDGDRRRARSRRMPANSSSIRACTSPGAQTVIGKSYPETGVEQGRAVLADSGAPSRDREARRHQARAPFHRRRAAAGAGRAAGQALPRDRRRPEGGGEGAGHGARSLGRRAQQAQASRRMDRRGVARRPASARRHRRRHRGAEPAGRAAVAAVGAQGLCRRERGLARRPGAASRHRQSTLRGACGGQRRSAQVFEETRSAPLASAETRQAITRAESRPQALALLLMAPEFQRR